MLLWKKVQVQNWSTCEGTTEGKPVSKKTELRMRSRGRDLLVS